jgi:hypothetical protein
MVLPLAITLLACSLSTSVSTGMTPAVTATPTPAPSATVVQVANSQHFADSKSGGTSAPCANGDPLIDGDCGETVTVTCASGDYLLGGGYAVDDFLAAISSSYPASATAWTVTAHDEGQDGGSHAFTITAYAECLHGNVSPGISAVSATPSVPSDGAFHEESLNCPAGSVVTGGGFRGMETDENIPATNGWTVDLGASPGSSPAPSIYTLCATHHLSGASHPTTIVHPDLGVGTSLSVSCPAGALLAGGGVHPVGFGRITGLMADGTVTHWQAQISRDSVVGGPVTTYTVTAFAVCVTVS